MFKKTTSAYLHFHFLICSNKRPQHTYILIFQYENFKMVSIVERNTFQKPPILWLLNKSGYISREVNDRARTVHYSYSKSNTTLSKNVEALIIFSSLILQHYSWYERIPSVKRIFQGHRYVQRSIKQHELCGSVVQWPDGLDLVKLVHMTSQLQQWGFRGVQAVKHQRSFLN